LHGRGNRFRNAKTFIRHKVNDQARKADVVQNRHQGARLRQKLADGFRRNYQQFEPGGSKSKAMKNKALALLIVSCAAVPAAFATDPTFGDVTTAAQSGILTFLSTNAAALIAVLLIVVGFKMVWRLTRGVGRV